MSPSSCGVDPKRSLERTCRTRELLAWKETLPKETGSAAAAASTGAPVPWAVAGPGAGLRVLQGGKLASGSTGMSWPAGAAAAIESLACSCARREEPLWRGMEGAVVSGRLPAHVQSWGEARRAEEGHGLLRASPTGLALPRHSAWTPLAVGSCPEGLPGAGSGHLEQS